jgi:hypothetical protein
MQMLNDYYSTESYLDSQKADARKKLFGDKFDIDSKVTDENISDIDTKTRIKLVKTYWSQKLGIPEKDIEIKHVGGKNYRLVYINKEGKKVK